jgi:hypothetical protein
MINNSLKKQNYTLFGSRYLNVDGLGVFKGVALMYGLCGTRKKERIALLFVKGMIKAAITC